MALLSADEKARLSSHQLRAYTAGRLSAEAVRMKGWLGPAAKVARSAKIVPKKVRRGLPGDE